MLGHFGRLLPNGPIAGACLLWLSTGGRLRSFRNPSDHNGDGRSPLIRLAENRQPDV